jgi:uncharacterized protein (TIGR02145 family)
MPDGRRWTSRNLNIPLLGWKYTGAKKEDGRFYSFFHVQIINALLKSFLVGWHVPTDEEWTALIDSVGGNPGTKLKSKTGWKFGGNGTYDFGFNVLPSGVLYFDGSGFDGRGCVAYFWSSSAYSSTGKWGRYFNYVHDTVYRTNRNRYNGFSVRLIKNKK